MEIIFPLSGFKCPETIRPHAERVFRGEYDVPVHPARPNVIDVGANCGAFSVWACHRWPGARVFAFEPMPDSYSFLQHNTAHLEQISTFEWAIGRGDGVRVMYAGTNDCGEASCHLEIGRADKTKPFHVELRDPLTLPQGDILKIDTEGCEIEILEPIICDGWRFDAIVLEYHRIEDRRRIDALLKDYTLTGASIRNYDRGILKFVHDSQVKK